MGALLVEKNARASAAWVVIIIFNEAASKLKIILNIHYWQKPQVQAVEGHFKIYQFN